MTGAERDEQQVADIARDAAAVPARDLVESLRELALLRDLDQLTEAEFQRAKEKVVRSRRSTGSQS